MGEARVPKPGQMANALFPSTGGGPVLKWRQQRTLGVQPLKIDPEVFDGWLMQFMEDNIDHEGERAVNEFTPDQIKVALSQPHSPEVIEFLKEALAVALETHSTTIALTSDAS